MKREIFLVLVQDTESGIWTIVLQTPSKGEAYHEHEKMKSDGTPTILLCADDFVVI